MSTYFYFECLDHEPPLAGEDEITQHDDEYLEHAIRIAQGEKIDPVEDQYGIGKYFHENAVRFLRQHGNCAVGVVSEYGDHRPIPGREKKPRSVVTDFGVEHFT